MKTTTIILKSAVFGLLISLQTTASAEYRCGWLENTIQGSYQLIDKQATWSIAKPGGYQVPQTSKNNLPEKLENEFVRTGEGLGYSCSCLSVTTDLASKRITSILYKGKQVLLKRCLEDETISSVSQKVLRFPGAATAQPSSTQPNTLNLAAKLPKPTGSYTDKPVLTSRVDTRQKTERYQDRPVVKTTVKSVTKGKAKPHYIQVIVTSALTKAKRLKKGFDSAGFKTIISNMKSKGRMLHKVRIGPYPSRSAALNSQKKLRNSFKNDQGVQKSIIVG